MPFRAKGIPTGLQIESYEGERNPYVHTSEDTIARMNMEYYLEQLKATLTIAIDLAGLPTAP